MANPREHDWLNKPWVASGIRISAQRLQGERLLCVTMPDGTDVAWVIYSDRTPQEHVDSHAIQKRISAANDLYAALEKCVDVFKQLADAGRYPEPLIGNGGWMFALDALKKARGE